MTEPPPDVVDLWTIDLAGEIAARRAAARAALRTILGGYLGLEAAQVPLRTTALGKPELSPATHGPAFSLSHTGHLAVVAVAARPALGVDIELAERRVSLSVMKRALDEQELASVLGTPDAGRDEAFLRHWTAKEAYVKALGIGLAAGMRRVVVADALTAPRIVPADGAIDAWSAQRFDPRPGVVGAVVVAGGPWTARPRLAARSL